MTGRSPLAACALVALFGVVTLAGSAACSSSPDAAPAVPTASAPDAGADAALTCAPGQSADRGACVDAGLVACPAGTSGSDGVCKPTFPASCKAGTTRILGETACVPVGQAACPAGSVTDASGWGCAITIAASCMDSTRATSDGSCVAVGSCPAALPAGPLRHVDGAGASDPTHFTTIAAALSGAPSGTIVSIAGGTYAELLTVPSGVSLVGTCADDVILEPAADSTEPAISANAGAITLRGLTIRGALAAIAVNGATVTADSLVIEGARGRGIEVLSGTLALKRSVIRSTTTSAAFTDGIALWALGGSTTLDDVTIDGSAGTGIGAWRTSKVVAHDVVITRIAKSPAGNFGWGVDVEGGGSFDGTRVFVSDTFLAGVSATDAGSHLTVTDSVIGNVALGTFGGSSPPAGSGISAVSGAVVEAHRVSIASTAGSSILSAEGAKVTADFITSRSGGSASAANGGLYVSNGNASLSSSVIMNASAFGIETLDGASVALDTVLVTDTKPVVTNVTSGDGIFASGGAITGKRVTLARNATAQLATSSSATVTLAALAAVDAVNGPKATLGGAGIGLLADETSTVTLTGAYFGQNKLLGLSLGRASKVEATGIVIDGVDLVNGNGGYGVHVLDGSSLTMSDFSIRGANGASLVISEQGSKAALARGTLRDVGPDTNPGLARGAAIQNGAVVSFDRVRVLGSTGTAFYVTSEHGAGTSMTITGSVIDGVVPGADGRFGDAFEVVAGAVLRVGGSVIRNAKGAALIFAGSTGSIDASLIEKNAIGLHVQDGSAIAEADAVPAELTAKDVVVTPSAQFVGNATRVGVGVLPLPQPLP